MEHPEPLALTTAQLLARFKISRSALAKLVKQGKLNPLPIFKRNKVFAYSEILQLLRVPNRQ